MKTLAFTRHGTPQTALRKGNRFVAMDITERFLRHVRIGDGCWEWIGNADPAGYGKFTWASKVFKRAHRVAWVLLGGNPEPPPSTFLLHSCDNPRCVRPSHLREGTQKQNIADMDARGRRGRKALSAYLRGEAHPRATITVEQAREIKRMLAENVKPSVIARSVGIKRQTVYNIKYTGTWATA